MNLRKLCLLCVVLIATCSFNIKAPEIKSAKAWMQAVTEGHVDTVKTLLDPTHIQARDGKGRTPLMLAVIAEQIDTIHMLIQAGANLEAYDDDGYTALMLAVSGGKVDIVQTLIQAGAYLEARDCDRRHDTALMWVARKGQTHIMKTLIQAGADFEAIDHEGLTALMWAVIRGKMDIVDLLIQAGADIEMQDDRGFTPLVYAIGNDYKDIIKLLVVHGADQKYASEFLRRKFLAAVWGLSGESQITDQEGDEETEFQLEGMPPRYILQKLPQYIWDFFHLNDDMHFPLSKEQKKEIHASIARAFQLTPNHYKHALPSLKLGIPITILGGSCDHSIGIVILKQQDRDPLLFICNRGIGRGAHTTETYSMQSEVTATTIKQLADCYPDVDAFYKMIAQLKLTHLGGFNKKEQKVGNCGWANSKGAFEILCRWYLQDDTDHHMGAEIYKRFTGFAREKALKEYLEESEAQDRDIQLLQKIKSKYLAKQANQNNHIILSEDVFKQI